MKPTIVESKFTVFALFDFVSEGNFPSTSPQRAYIWRGDLMEGFLRYHFEARQDKGDREGIPHTHPIP